MSSSRGDVPRTYWTRRGGVALDREKLAAEEREEAAELAGRFVSQNVKYSVDEFEANLREIERQVGTLAYLKGDKSIGAAAAAAAKAEADAALAAEKERRRRERVSRRRSSLKEQRAREERDALRKMKEVLPRSIFELQNRADFDQFLEDTQLQSREWIEDEIKIRQGEDGIPDFNEELASKMSTARPDGPKIGRLPTLTVSSLSRYNHIDQEAAEDEMILWTMRDVERKGKRRARASQIVKIEK